MGQVAPCSQHKCCDQTAKQGVERIGTYRAVYMEMDDDYAVEVEVCWDEVSNASSPAVECSASVGEQSTEALSDDDSDDRSTSPTAVWLACGGGGTDADTEIINDTGYVGVHALKKAMGQLPPREASRDMRYTRPLAFERGVVPDCERGGARTAERDQIMAMKDALNETGLHSSPKDVSDRLLAMRRAVGKAE